MLKRFYSKRSGFTLVEIIIAFAIFSIMAAMVCQVLELSVSARRSNNIYAAELAEQEKLLTVLEKTSDDFSGTRGNIKFNLGGVDVELPYDVLSADPNAEFVDEGLNYYIANVNYQATGEGLAAEDGAEGAAGSYTGSQASRMDTRITGTSGIGFVRVLKVVKDTHTYAAGDPYAVPAGHTRYYFQTSASSKPLGSTENTLKDEDVPYSQYRLFFYDKSKYNEAARAVKYTDQSGKKYTKEVYATAQIAKVGYLNTQVTNSLGTEGLTSSKVASGLTNNYNKYTIDWLGSNSVRIGTPFTKDNGANGGMGGKGLRFEGSNFSNFYIDFVGENVDISNADFGHNGVKNASEDLGYSYGACPMYLEKYDSSGKPTYDAEDKNHVNIYGAFLYERVYVAE